MKLAKGQNVPLSGGSTSFSISLDAGSGLDGLDLDVSALIVDAGRQVLSDDHFVFFNQPTDPVGSVKFACSGEGQVVTIRISQVPQDGAAVLVCGSLADRGGTPMPFSGLGALRVVIAGDDGLLLSFEPDGLSTETALVFGEFYRRDGGWKFRAVGQGYDTGLAGIAREFGVHVSDDADDACRQTQVSVTEPVSAVPPPSDVAPPASDISGAAVPGALAGTAADDGHHTQTFWRAAAVWNAAYDANEQVLELFVEAVTAATAAMSDAESSIAELFRAADGAKTAMVDALQEIHETVPTATSARFVSGMPRARERVDGSLEEWIRQANELAEEIRVTRVPLKRSNRDNMKWGFARQVGTLVSSQEDAELSALLKHHPDAVRAGDAAFARRIGEFGPHFDAAVAARPGLPAVVDSLELPDLITHPPAAGAGPLLVRVGSVTPGEGKVLGRQPVSAQYRTEQEASRTVRVAQPWSVPVLLDMNLRAGIVTTDPRVVNNTLLRLLTLVPAGQLKLTLFDPVRLGDSAKFVFGLGSVADTIIGEKVRSTDRELAGVLESLEEHLTFVTQKYLQGQYEMLGDYNEAAGEVAEPYRALVLYDYPNGFVRPGGSVDDEMVGRLRKIVGAGQRCGVMTFVVLREAQFMNDDPAASLLPLFPTVPMEHWLARHLTAARSGQQEPTHLKVLVPGYLHMPLPEAARSSAAGACIYSRQVEVTWRFVPDPEPAPEVVAELLAGVERGLLQASDVRVGLEQVASLAIAKQDRDVARGTRELETLPRPSDPATWWHGSAADGIAAAFGRVGANELGVLELDSQIASGALVGGRMGSGKSVLLHAIILSLVTRYGPDELNLYLVDFKEGVEFKSYASHALPHAKVVAVESHREFGLSVLQSLDAEITRRGALFRASDGQELNLGQYRRRSGEPLPRIVLLIDEFHVLFNTDDRIASAAADLLDRIVRQGRAFGVHVLLASQTLSGTAALNKTTLGLIPIRLALQSSEADSRVLLADDNPDARLLTRPGEGILNTKGGLKDANSRFQAAFTSPDERARMLTGLRELANRRGQTGRPVVFEGKEAARVDEAPVEAFGQPTTRSTTLVPVGLPLTLDPPVAAALRREPGGNLLLVMGDDAGYAALTVAATSLLRSGAVIDVLDYGPLDAPWEQQLTALAGAGMSVHRRHTASAVLAEASRLVQERHDLSDLTAPPRVLLLTALHRAREFDTSMADGPEPDQLAHVLREGPDVGVHVIAWVDKPVSLGRRLTSSMQREFSLRLLGPMSKDDSFTLIDSDVAASLNASQVVLDDRDRVVTVRARRFGMPNPGWCSTMVGR